MQITDKTSKDKLKKQIPYFRGKYTIFKYEYWNHASRKKGRTEETKNTIGMYTQQ
jgi:hypothetical protein